MFERFTDRARRVIVLAQDEAKLLNHNYIGTEHLLLGLIHEGEGVAAKALESMDISLDAVRAQIVEITPNGFSLERRCDSSVSSAECARRPRTPSRPLLLDSSCDLVRPLSLGPSRSSRRCPWALVFASSTFFACCMVCIGRFRPLAHICYI